MPTWIQILFNAQADSQVSFALIAFRTVHLKPITMISQLQHKSSPPPLSTTLLAHPPAPPSSYAWHPAPPLLVLSCHSTCSNETVQMTSVHAVGLPPYLIYTKGSENGKFYLCSMAQTKCSLCMALQREVKQVSLVCVALQHLCTLP